MVRPSTVTTKEEKTGRGFREWLLPLTSTLKQLPPAAIIWTLILSALAAVMCFIPLFNILGYESSLVTGLAVCLAGAHLGVIQGNRAALAGPGPTSPHSPLLPAWVKSAIITTATLLPPLAILALNGLRVKNCNMAGGFAFYLLLPVVSGWVAAGWGTGAGALFKKQKTAMGVVMGVGLVSLGLALYRLYVHPQVTGYGAMFGFFSGALYDEEITIPRALLWARLYHLAGAGFVVTMTGLPVWRRQAGTLSRLPLPILTGSLLLLLITNSDSLGFYRDSASVQKALGGVRHTDHLTIYHPTRFTRAQVDRLADDLEYRLHQTSTYLGLEPAVPSQCPTIEVYVYQTAAQREELTGLGNTSLARPWSCQIHLIRPRPGDRITSHEMAHVVAGRFARPPLYLPALARILPHMALVEGAAEAATAGWNHMNVHERAAALDQLGMLPDITAIMGAQGFWTAPPGRAYTAGGSFVGWLIDNQGGTELFALAYETGRLEQVYGKPLSRLNREWKEYLASVRPDQDAVMEARARYGGQSIFTKECAHERANTHQLARRARAENRHRDAVSLFNKLIQMAPDQGIYHLEKARTLAAGGDGDREQAIHAARRAHEMGVTTSSLSVQTGAMELLGDLAWLGGDRDGAAAHWEQAGATAPSDQARLRLRWRLEAINGDRWGRTQEAGSGPPGETPAGEEEIRRYLTGEEEEPDLAMVGLARVAERYPANLLAQYLLGRHLEMRQREDQAIPLLEAALQSSGPENHTLPHRSPGHGQQRELAHALVLDAYRSLGMALYHSRQYDRAREVFVTLEQAAPSQSTKEAARDWQERCHWKAAAREQATRAGK